MEFGTREILIVLGILILVAIVLDGLRRVRQSRYGKLRNSKRKQPIFDDEGDDYGSELPSGPARVVQVRDPDSCEQLSQKIRQSSDLSQSRQTSVFRARVGQPVGQSATDSGERLEPHFDDSQRQGESVTPPLLTPAEPDGETAAVHEDEFVAPQPVSRADEPEVAASQEAEPAAEPLSSKPLVAEPDRPRPQPASRQHRELENDQDDDRPRKANPDEVLVLHLMAQKGQEFQGEELLRQLLDHKLRFGAMKIFHRHDGADGTGFVHFSLANCLNPGTFDLSSLSDFSTPGVTFFMPLGDLPQPIESFELLIDTATSMAKKLNGELKDETRSALTRQTIEHYRQRVIDFTRRSFTLTN